MKLGRFFFFRAMSLAPWKGLDGLRIKQHSAVSLMENKSILLYHKQQVKTRKKLLPVYTTSTQIGHA
jgi:hypothetical protein